MLHGKISEMILDYGRVWGSSIWEKFGVAWRLYLHLLLIDILPQNNQRADPIENEI